LVFLRHGCVVISEPTRVFGFVSLAHIFGKNVAGMRQNHSFSLSSLSGKSLPLDPLALAISIKSRLQLKQQHLVLVRYNTIISLKSEAMVKSLHKSLEAKLASIEGEERFDCIVFRTTFAGCNRVTACDACWLLLVVFLCSHVVQSMWLSYLLMKI
jgi:hypothetical protein